MKFSVALNEKESILLLNYMKENNIKSKAEAIITYRQNNGLFKSIEDIMKVSGIGKSTYEKFKANITI